MRSKRRELASVPVLQTHARARSVRLSRFRLGEEDLIAVAIPTPAAPATADLTDAQAHILACLGRGMTNAEIGRARKTSPRTVANQLRELFRKFGVGSRSELVARTRQ